MDWDDAYLYDEGAAVRTRADRRVGHEYTDGTESEAHILQSVLECADVSSGSDELVAKIRDWPSEYHFSASRATLLAPFDLCGLGVLEVGCGCGALTRALGESGARVVALEGSHTRARITAARCRGLDDVQVVCDDFRDFIPPALFDVVLLVGVLEYAPLYFGGADPVGEALGKACACLAQDGAVVIAMENQLGLKYFAGRGEDHAGRQFFGIEDRYRDHHGPVTFGRRELEGRLADAGLTRRSVYYPFPDYKLPRLILTEDALEEPRLQAGRLAGDLASRDYQHPFPPLFAEDAAWEVVGRNGLLRDLSNSFLVVAGRSPDGVLAGKPPWLAELRSSDRVRAFRSTTRIVTEGEDLVVLKARTCGSSAPPPGAPVVQQIPERTPYLPGAPLALRVRRLLRKTTADPAEIAGALRPWIDLLRTAASGEGPDAVLPAEYLDAVPWNLMERDDGLAAAGDAPPAPFDLEWALVAPLRVEHVFVRGLLSLLVPARGEMRFGADLTMRDLVLAISADLGLPLDDTRLADLIAVESAIQATVFGMDAEETRARMEAELAADLSGPGTLSAELERRENRVAQLTDALAGRDRTLAERDQAIAERDQAIAELQSRLDTVLRERAETLRQIDRVEASASWRLTAPLRRLKRRLPGDDDSGR